MRIKCFLFVFVFSLSCYSQKSLKIDISISRVKKGLVVKFKNESDSIFILRNGDGFSNPVLWGVGNYVYVKTNDDGFYEDNKALYPLLPETGEVWYKKKHKTASFITPKQEVTMDILGIKEDLLAKDKLYVKLVLPFRKGVKGQKFTHERLVIEKWVPVE